MTVRLVGLMSLVLALCLATFALMTRRYHDEVMHELPRTVAQAGQAAIRSLDPAGFAYRVAGPGDVPIPPVPSPTTIRRVRERTAELDRLVDGDAAREALSDGRKIVIERTLDAGSTFWTTFGDCAGQGADCFEWRTPGGDGEETRIIRIDAIHAQADAETGVLLRIPTLRSTVVRGDRSDEIVETVEAVDTAGAFRVFVDDGTGTPDPGGAPPAFVGRDIVLPIRTDDYQEAYDRFRSKSLLLLAGVFGVGLALTTGLATRFTRPVRRLDGAVREIADGNLDVEVPVHGRDELARLGRAFNEMTHKLREGRERARELTRREKLSALGRLAAGVAHDVRNPLHSISLTLDHLGETHRPGDGTRGEDFDRSLGIIREEIRRLDGLVSSFLRFAASGGRERTRVRLGAMLGEVARLVAKEAEWRGVRVETRVADPDPEVEVDLESIRASILNLVLNAFEAMPEGGDLTLAARIADGEAVLEVRDTGVGIPEDEQDRVFDFAWSTRDGGSGLGLAIVHQCVVEDHGGRVRLDSRPGKGTTFTLHLPAGEDAGARS